MAAIAAALGALPRVARLGLAYGSTLLLHRALFPCPAPTADDTDPGTGHGMMSTMTTVTPAPQSDRMAPHDPALEQRWRAEQAALAARLDTADHHPEFEA